MPAIIAGIKVIASSVATGVAWGIGIGVVGNMVTSVYDTNVLPSVIQLPMFVLSPQEIFENEIPLLDVNFFNPDSNTVVNQNPDGSTAEQTSAALTLQPVISQWYNALRNLAIVALLSILVYMGIRIIISSSAEDKAKYKQRMLDWLIGMCLLFFMHYIMAFAITVTEEVTKAVQSINDEYSITIGNVADVQPASGDKRQLSDYMYSDGKKVFDFSEGTMGKLLRDQGIIQQAVDGDGNEISDQYYIIWPTNLMGKARVELQVEPAGMDYTDMAARQFGYTIIYLALVMYTILFLFRYLKRMMMLAFLTMIAPLMAMTYPLDKMRDGSAQGFNTWLKEYLFNLLIQPVHLILYTVLIGSAMDLVADNLVYALVALGFILQAEKILRKFFGFDKATTVDNGSALGGALAMQGINTIGKMLGRGNKGGKGDKGGNGQNRQLTSAGSRRANKGKDVDELTGRIYGNGQSQDAPRQLTEEETAERDQLRAELDNADYNDMYLNPDVWQQRQDRLAELERGRQSNPTPQGDDSGTLQTEHLHQEDEEIQPIEAPLQGDEEDTRGIGAVAIDKLKSTGLGQAIQGGIRTVGNVAGGVGRRANELIEGKKRRMGERVSRLPKPVRNTGRNIANHAKEVGKAVKYVAPRAAKIAGKAAIRGTLIGAGAVAGLTAGLVSDDFSNVPKWAATGAGAGLIAGAGVTHVGDRVSSVGDKLVASAEAEYAATHTKDEVKARQNAQADRLWAKDEKAIKIYQDKLKKSKKETREIMQKHAKKYREYGITDDEIIVKAMTADDPYFGAKDDYSSEKRIYLAKLATEVGTDKKQLEQVEKGLKKRGNIPQHDIDMYGKAIRGFNDWS